MGRGVTRRRLVVAGLGSLAAGSAVARRGWAQSNGVTTFVSPPLEKWAQPLPRLARAGAGGELAAAQAVHRFHPALPDDLTWGYGGQPYLGPVLEAHRDDAVRLLVRNELGPHRFARDLDPTVHGASEIDRAQPRVAVHLHGALTRPGSDGHPLATVRPGGVRRHVYGNRQEAAALWYHDHAMGITRLNVYAGLAGLYLLRDDFDTGARDNPLGLPHGRCEVPLVFQDKMFDADGRLLARTSTYVAEGTWEGGQAGDTAVVNGAVWPELAVPRCLHRLRLLNAANLRTFGLRFTNGMPFWVIGNDGGLLNRPVQVDYARLAASERLDVLVDFGRLAPGETVALENVDRLPVQFQVFGDPILRELVRFKARPTRGPQRRVPSRLRGGRRRPRPLEPWPAPVRTRDMTVAQPGDARFPPALMNLNNLEFDTWDTENVHPGEVERWRFVNLTTDEHPIHLHIATMRVLERQAFDVVAYSALGLRPPLGQRWAPPPDKVLRGTPRGPDAWERGNKDTVYAPAGEVTSVLVRWPMLDELGFDPDATFPVPATIAAGAPGTDAPDGTTFQCRLSTATQPEPDRARGYVWHCHVIDHEDHEMMLPIRLKP